MELMVVVILIAILAMLAIPAMSVARADRLAWADASNITELLRRARTRSLSRGSAVVVRFQADVNGSAAPTQRGRFEMWEAVTPNASGSGWNRTPRSSCKSPTRWTLDATIPPPSSANAAFLDAVDLNGGVDVQSAIQTQVVDPTTQAATTDMFLCFTPLGRVYYSASNSGTPNFDLSPPIANVTQVRLYRYSASGVTASGPAGVKFTGTLRTVTLPGAGMARLVSQ
jgi:type IV fimbrial biogenesis protein FimT